MININIIKTLKDKLGNIIYPQTREKAVYADDNTRLDNKLAGMISSINGKFDKSSIAQSAEISDATKVHSSAVTAAMATQISGLMAITNNLTWVSINTSSWTINSVVSLINVRYRPATKEVWMKIITSSTAGLPNAGVLISGVPVMYRPSSEDRAFSPCATQAGIVSGALPNAVADLTLSTSGTFTVAGTALDKYAMRFDFMYVANG